MKTIQIPHEAITGSTVEFDFSFLCDAARGEWQTTYQKSYDPDGLRQHLCGFFIPHFSVPSAGPPK